MAGIAELAGEIRLQLTGSETGISRVGITSTRPLQAARVFEGKTPDEMCAAIGRIFSLCGTAQTVAALTAVEAGLGIAPDPAVSAARDAARRAEFLTQIATRLGLHWPRALGLPPAPAAVRVAMSSERGIEADVLGFDWRRPGAGAPGQGGADLPPRIDVAALVAPLWRALAERGFERFGALPRETPPEHGVFATYWDDDRVAGLRDAHGPGLAARLAAAECALLQLPVEIGADIAAAGPAGSRAASRDSGQGVATVETARGPLTHRVEIAAGIVTLCQTEAPTEPNFAEDGPVAAGLIGAAMDPVAAELHVLAIDPCVVCRVELAPG